MKSISIVKEFINMFTKNIENLGKETGFIQREGNLKAKTFIMAFSLSLLDIHKLSLKNIATKCEEYQNGFKISKQAIFGRLKTGKILMKAAFEKTMNEILFKRVSMETMEVLKQFSDIKITDSTTISLPDKLADTWVGLGGNNSKSAIKIQTTYSTIKKAFDKFELSSATVSDADYNKSILKDLKCGELSLNDRGYYSLEFFEGVINKLAYFISRIKSNTIFYIKSKENENKYDRIDITDILNNSRSSLDIYLYIKGTKGKMLEVRVVAVQLPEIVINKKRRNANTKAISQGNTLGEREGIFLEWNILITNIPEDMLEVRTICELYRMRWQIELIFKGFKSGMSFDCVGNVGKDYFECLIYGRLIIAAAVSWMFSMYSFLMYSECKQLLSIQQFIDNIRNSIGEILNKLRSIRINPLELSEIFQEISRKSKFEMRNRETTEQILMEHDLPEYVLQFLV